MGNALKGQMSKVATIQSPKMMNLTYLSGYPYAFVCGSLGRMIPRGTCVMISDADMSDMKYYACCRDSGSKMCRLGLASTLKIGQTFPGVVLSSEASICASPADLELVQTHGISGINCSWNR